MQPADKVVERLIFQIVSQEPGYQYFKAEPGIYVVINFYNFVYSQSLCIHIILVAAGMDITLVVNNLGGTSYLELYLVANAAVRYLSMTKSKLVYYY